MQKVAEKVIAKPMALTFLAHFALSNVILSAYKLGIFKPFFEDPDNGTLNPKEFIEKNKFNERMVNGLVEYLTLREVFVNEGNGNYSLGELGVHLIKEKWISYVLFYVGGYGNILSNSDKLGSGEYTYGKDIIRDIDWVAKGTELMSLTRHHQSYANVLEVANRQFSNNVLDIGCGTGNFLMKLAKAANCKLGVGIDISAEACSLARTNVLKSPIKISIEEGDFVSNTKPLIDKYGNFDVVTALMIIHEYLFYGDEKVIEVLISISQLLSPNGTFILLDKANDVLPEAPLYFTEYKLVHDLTHQDLCSRSKWHQLISDAGMEIVNERLLPRHTGTILIECRRK